MDEINRGPLTTTFIPPSSCASLATNIYKVDWYYLQGPIELGDCWPSSYSSGNSEYYSPGLCPSGYAPACSRTHSIDESTETIHTCCPTMYHYTCQVIGNLGTGGCFWWMPSTRWTMTSVYVVTEGSTWLVDTTTGLEGAINAPSIQVRFQSTDFVSSTSSVSTSIEASSRTGSTSITSDTNEYSAAPVSDNGGITTGTQVGIGVGVSLGVLGLLAIGALVFFKRRKRKGPHRELYELPNQPKSRNELREITPILPVEMMGDDVIRVLPAEM